MWSLDCVHLIHTLAAEGKMASYKGDKGDDQSMCMVKPGPGYINCLAGSIVDSYIAENSGLVQAEGQHRGTKTFI